MQHTRTTSQDVSDFRKAAKAYAKEKSRDSKTALDALIELGFLTRKGNLKAPYKR